MEKITKSQFTVFGIKRNNITHYCYYPIELLNYEIVETF